MLFCIPELDSISWIFWGNVDYLTFHSENILHVPVGHLGKSIESNLLSLFSLSFNWFTQVDWVTKDEFFAEDCLKLWNYLRAINGLF